jgi:cytochrome c-type biogenesis protein CcmH
MAWLQARYMAGGGSVDPLTREIAQRVLEQNPNQPLVLELFAIDAFRQENYREAVSLLNRALSGSVGENQRNALSAGLSEARKRLGDLTPSLDINIAAATSAPAGATLFVIARPVGGGMPYAVVRRAAPQLPLTVRLDDAVSMNPALALSAAGEVEVVVRLSLSGAPMAHPGDWQWQSPTISLEALDAPVSLQATLSPPVGS